MKRIISSSFGEKLSVCIVLAVCFLAGCEAPLVLDGVEQEKDKAVRRSDSFLSMASNNSSLVVVGNRGATVISADGGQTWQRKNIPSKPFLMDVDACPDNSFVALDYQANVWLLKETGAEWVRKDMGSTETPQAIACDLKGRIWVVGSFSSINLSDDSGETWSESSLDEDLHFTTVQFLDESNGLLLGEFGVVAKTIDGGESWEMLDPIPDEFYPHDAWFKSVQQGWVVGLNGTVYYTGDAGGSWQSQETGTSDPIYRIAANGNSLYAVGGNGLVLSCEGCIDQGASAKWQKVEHGLPIRFYLRGVVPFDDKLWIAGGAGALHEVTLKNTAGQNNINKVVVSGGAE